MVNAKDWVLTISDHVGATLLILAVCGVSTTVAWSLLDLGRAGAIIGGLVLVMLVLGEGAYRAWNDRPAAQNADPTAAQTAFANSAISEAHGFLDDLSDPRTQSGPPQSRDVGDAAELNRIRLDIVHWEGEVRAKLRGFSGRKASREFDLDDAGASDWIHGTALISATRSYVERRIRRLEEWRDSD